MAQFGANIMGSNLAVYLSMAADKIIVGAVNGKEDLGLYERSYNLVVRPLSQLMALASRVAVPLLSRLQETPKRYARAYLLMLQLTTAACVHRLIAAIAAAAPMVLLLFGPEWVAMAPLLMWICFGGVASALSASTSWLFTTQNRTGEQLRFTAITTVISISSFVVGSYWGVVGVAALSALALLFLQTPLIVWAAVCKGPVTPRLLVAGLLPLLAAGAASAAATGLVVRLMSGHSSLALAVLAAFAGPYGSFALALWAQPAGRRLIANTRSMLIGPRPG